MIQYNQIICFECDCTIHKHLIFFFQYSAVLLSEVSRTWCMNPKINMCGYTLVIVMDSIYSAAKITKNGMDSSQMDCLHFPSESVDGSADDN